MSTLTPNTFANISFSGGGGAALPKTTYSTVAPVSTTSFNSGDTWYVTPLGTQADHTNATEQYRFDGTNWVKTPAQAATPQAFTKTVFVDTIDPNTSTIFDTNNPPVTNDNALKNDSNNIYIGANRTTWTYNSGTSTYDTYVFPDTSPYVITAFRDTADALLGGFTASINKYTKIDTVTSTANALASFNTTTYRFTPTRAGLYDVKASYSIFRSVGDNVSVMIRKNGTIISLCGGIGGDTNITSTIVYMNGTTDYLDATNQGGLANASRAQQRYTSFFQASWIPQ